jgi:hypothetical protein
MVPLWSRAWKFASIYAYATIDVLFAILWFAAAIAVAAWNAQTKPPETTPPPANKPPPAMFKRDDNNSGGCAAFAHGSATRCGISKVSVSFAILVSLLFGATAFFAIRVVAEYRRTGVLPATNAPATLNHARPGSSEGDPNKDPWSTNTDELEPEATDRLRYGQDVEEIEQGLLHRQSYGNEGQYPARAPSYQSEVSLTPSTAYDQIPHTPHDGTADARVKFPTANYDATHI